MQSEDNIQPKDGLEELISYEENRLFVSRAIKVWLSAIYEQDFQGNETVLEVGSGLGFLQRNWPVQFDGKWVQFDLNPLALQVARQIYPAGNYVAGSAFELPFEDNSFDVVCGFNCYDLMLAYQDRAFKEASRVLKEGGFFLHLGDLLTPLNRQNSAGEETEVEDMIPYDRFRIVTSEMHKQLLPHFDPEKIRMEIMYQYIRGRRTEQQRTRGRFVFLNYLGEFVWTDRAIYGDNIYGVSRWRKFPYEVLRHVLPPLASKIEPKSLEVLYASYVKAKK